MKYITIAAMIIAGAFAAVAGEPATYRLEVQDFKELKVTDAINVDYVCSPDSAGWVEFECEPEMASSLLLTNNKSCLHIQVATEMLDGRSLPTVRVYSSSLTKVENLADSTVRVLSNVPVTSFKARIVGNGTLVVRDVEAISVDAGIATGKGHLVISNGKAAKAKLSNVGTGPLEAGGMAVDRLKVMALGTGPVDCWALETLSLYGAGSCTVYYRGQPEKITNRSIGVKLVHVD
ncbi:MAG: DUF2807 domain-containing protein [Bacteroidales bacterium]|nr:DUF2807 domain-containing protein [Bacteroidales bacterium]